MGQFSDRRLKFVSSNPIPKNLIKMSEEEDLDEEDELDGEEGEEDLDEEAEGEEGEEEEDERVKRKKMKRTHNCSKNLCSSNNALLPTPFKSSFRHLLTSTNPSSTHQKSCTRAI